MLESETQEEVTGADSPQRVVRKTITSVEPQVKGEAPQKVFDKKKTIFRFTQVIWYILGVMEVLLAFRVVLKALGANPFIGFTSFIYTITDPLVIPFQGILRTSVTGNSTIEWSTLIAAAVYVCVAWGLVYLLDLIYPITPRDVE